MLKIRLNVKVLSFLSIAFVAILINTSVIKAAESDNGMAKTDVQAVKNGWYTDTNGDKMYYQDGKYLRYSQTIDGKEYYFDSYGKMYTGWLTYNDDGRVRYYTPNDGSMAQNEWQTINGYIYYFDNVGEALKGEQKIHGIKYYFYNDSGILKLGGHKFTDGKIRYYNSNGEMLTNSFFIYEGNKYYAGEDGTPVYWNRTINGKDYYFNGYGQLYTGWLTFNDDGRVRYYKPSDGSMAQNEWQTIDGKKYYFDAKGQYLKYGHVIANKEYYFNGYGQLYTGWLTFNDDGRVRYYKPSDGSMAQNEWQTIDGKKYYFDAKGQYLKYGHVIANKEYYFNGYGQLYTGWLTFNDDGRVRYYKPSDGSMAQNEWQMIDGKKYYFDAKGQYLKYGHIIGGKEYYFNSYGQMYSGWLTFNDDGRTCYYNSNGELEKNKWISDKNGKRYVNDRGIMLKNTKYTIDDVEYVFDENGYVNGWMKGNDGYYYFYSNGIKLTGWQTVYGQKYFFNDKGQRIGNGPVKKVIDISEHNGVVDWETVKQKGGVDYVILRCGYGTELSQEDNQFKRNVKELTRLGIPFGVYLYSYATNDDEAALEAQNVHNILSQYGVSKDTEVYYDLERFTINGVGIDVSKAQYEQIVTQFMSSIQKLGYNNAYIYSYTSYLESNLNSPLILPYVKWVAQYNYTCTYEGSSYWGWQYSSTEKLDGIKGNVDMSVWFE